MKKIEITTTQNVTIEYNIASVFDRIAAFILDNIIIIIGFSIIGGLFSVVFSGLKFEYFDNSFILIFLFLLYPILMELFNNGQTLGKMMIKIRVMKITGEKLTAFDCILRGLFRIIDTMMTFGILATVGVISSERGQRLGGALSDTVVIKSDNKKRIPLSHVLNLKKKLNHEPTYKGIKTVDEKHLLLIKEVIQLNERQKTEANKKALFALAKKMGEMLEVDVPKNKMTFLKNLLNDYVVLTR